MEDTLSGAHGWAEAVNKAKEKWVADKAAQAKQEEEDGREEVGGGTFGSAMSAAVK